MTIHRAKGLEFPVVCVADLGRAAAAPRERLLIGRDGAAGVRLATLAGGDAVPALGWSQIAAELDREDAEEERRLLYVAATRAADKLILSASTALDAWPAARPGCAPADWLLPALLGDPGTLLRLEAPERTVIRHWAGREARMLVRVATPATLDALGLRRALVPEPRARPVAPGTALPPESGVRPVAPGTAPPPESGARPVAPGTALPLEPAALERTPLPASQSRWPAGDETVLAAPRLSYSALGAYARCPYRFYLERVLRLPREPVPARPSGEAAPDREPLEARLRGTLVHRLLEDLDFAHPAPPVAEAVRALGRESGVELGDDEVADVQALVAAFGGTSLCARLAAAAGSRSQNSRPRREAPFAFALEPGGGGPLVTGFVDVLARGADGGALVVDYKSDRLEGEDPAAVVERDYATQRVVYALAALHDGAPSVEVAYCFLEAPGAPVSATFTPRDLPALTERVLALARGVLAGEYPPTAVPHRELCGDCPGRPALCSWDEATTLRAPAEAGLLP